LVGVGKKLIEIVNDENLKSASSLPVPRCDTQLRMKWNYTQHSEWCRLWYSGWPKPHFSLISLKLHCYLADKLNKINAKHGWQLQNHNLKSFF